MEVMTLVVSVVLVGQLQAILEQEMLVLLVHLVKEMLVDNQIQITTVALVAEAEKALLEETQQVTLTQAMVVLEDQQVYKALLLLLQVEAAVEALVVTMVVLVVLAVAVMVEKLILDNQELQAQAAVAVVLETMLVTHQVLVVLAL